MLTSSATRPSDELRTLAAAIGFFLKTNPKRAEFRKLGMESPWRLVRASLRLDGVRLPVISDAMGLLSADLSGNCAFQCRAGSFHYECNRKRIVRGGRIGLG